MTHPLVYAGWFAAIVILFLLLRWAWARRTLKAEAVEDYAQRRLDRAGTIRNVSAEAFERLFVAAYEPRWALYAAGALAGAAALTYPAIFLLANLWIWGFEASGAGPWFDVGYYPWMFYIFFGLVAIWAICAAVAARLHHLRQPEGFQAALARARGEPLDDVKLPRPRPKWARRAVPNPPGRVRAGSSPGSDGDLVDGADGGGE